MARNSVNYETDFYAWTVEQGRLLRLGELTAIDAANIAEEIEGMGRSDRRELKSRLIVLLAHLLKWLYQPEARSRSWSSTIREQRQQVELILEDSPSLRPTVAQILQQVYSAARERAADETGLADDAFPQRPPFTTDEVLSRSFLPER